MAAEEKPKRKTQTSSAVKNRYRKKTYKTYTFLIRYEDELYKDLESYKGSVGTLVKALLEEYFAKSK